MIKRKIIISLIILIILVSFSICIGNLFFNSFNINKNIRNKPEVKIDDNNYSLNYTSENKNILFQINILKNTILNNNSLLKNYNRVFNHNINYIRYQKNILNIKIDIANSSIKHELNILNQMKNIMNNHHYNYLKFFRNNNYYIPKIFINSGKKVSNKMTNIKTYSSKLDKKSTSINSIFYQSEEAVVGIKNTKILISSTKLLILSKINFNNSSILYFSKYLNNLITYNKFTNTYNSYVKRQTSTRNKFILNLKSNEQKKSLYTKNYFSNKTSSDNYIVHRPYIITTPILAIVGVVIIFLGGNAKRKRKARERVARWHISDLESYEIPPITKVRKEEKTHDSARINIETTNKDTEGLYTDHEDMDTYQPPSVVDTDVSKQKHVLELSANSDELRIPSSSSSLSLLSSDSNQAEQENNYQNIQDEVDDTTDIDTTEAGNTQNTISSNPFNTNNNEVTIYCGENKVITYSNESEVPASMRIYSSKRVKGLKVIYNRSTYVIQNHEFESGIKTHTRKVIWNSAGCSEFTHTHLLINGHLEETPESKSLALIVSKDEKSKLSNKWLDAWLDAKEQDKRTFYKWLYSMRNKKGTCNEVTFQNQVSNYLYERLLSSKEQGLSPNSIHIFSNINDEVENSKNNGLTDTERYDALSCLKNITKFRWKQREIVNRPYTKYGWFQKPDCTEKKKIVSKNITKEDYEYLQGQHKKLNNIESLLPKSSNSEEYFKTLFYGIKTIPESSTIDPKISQLDKFIANQILHDLREIIQTYKSYIDISKVNVLNLPDKLRERFTFMDYVEKLNYLCLVRNNFGGVSQTGISEELLYTYLGEVHYL